MAIRAVRPVRATVAAALVTSALGACTSSSSSVVRAPTGSVPVATSPAPPSRQPSTATKPSTGTPVKTRPMVAVTPAKGLKNGATVTVTATGFSPNEPLIVVQCADRGKATGQGDCNLAAMNTVVSDSTGRVTATVPVVRGPFGTNKRTCDAAHPCLISVSQATLNPSQEADAPISFGK